MAAGGRSQLRRTTFAMQIGPPLDSGYDLQPEAVFQ
jgi:hypothetical protein